MSEKQRLKHEADALAKKNTPESYPVHLGDSAREGLKFFTGPDTKWIFAKQRPTQSGSAKNAPEGPRSWWKSKKATLEEETQEAAKRDTNELTPVS